MKPGYLIDMDGVIYKGSVMIPGAVEFIKALRDNDLPFRFMTNNSQRTRLDIMTKLLRYGFDVNEEHIYTCAMATACWCRCICCSWDCCCCCCCWLLF